jgi:hypothetical protein
MVIAIHYRSNPVESRGESLKKSVKQRMIRGNRDFCIFTAIVSLLLAISYERKLELIFFAIVCFFGAYLFYLELKTTDWARYEE